jgi:PAS domain S-box-containing protein
MKLKRAPNFSIEDLPFPVIVHRQKGGLIIDINAKAKKLFGLRAFKAKTIGEIRQTKLAKHKEKEGIDSIRYNAVPHITVKKKPALLSFSQKKIVSSGEKCFVDFYRCELDEALIGESKNTDQQLKESKSNFNRLQEVAGIGTWEMNGKFQEYHWSDEFYRIHGLKPQSVKPSTRLRLSMVHLRDRAKLQSALDRAYKEGKPYSLEKRIVLPNKEIRWVLSKGEVTTDQKTGKRKVFGTITDITQRKLQEQRESQITNRLRETLLFGRIGMVELNIKSGELEMHEEMLLLLEENNSSSKKIHVQDFIKRYVLEEDVASVFQKLKEGSALGHAEMKEVHVEFRMKTAKGNILFIDAHFTFRKDGTALGVLRDITLKRKAQQEALTSASKIETMLNGVTDGIFAVDNDLNFTMVNPVFAKQAQLKPNQMVGQNMLKLYPYMKGGVLVEAYKKAIKTQQSARIEHFNSIDPSQVFEINIYPNTQGLFVYYKDVSSVKKAQHNSLENEVYLNGILDSTNDGILAVNNEGKIIKSNDRFIELWKIPQELLSTGDDDLVLTHVVDQLTDPESFLIKVDELYHSLEQSFDILEFNDGRIFERYSRPLIITNEVAGRVWSFRDITTQRNSEVRFKSIFESTTDSIFFINKDYEIMAFNKIAYENTLAQFNQELAIGRNMLEIITPEAWPSFKENIDKAIDGELIQKEIEIHYPNHKNIWWFIQYIPVRDADGKIIGVSFNSTNIDDEKRANERIKALADNIPDGFIYEFLTNAEGSDYRFIYGSQGVENLFEMSVEEFTADASKVFQMTHPDDDEEAQRAFQKSLENLSNYESDYRITTRSGKLKWIRSKSRPILQSDGRILYEGISMDITHQKELEAEQALNRNKLQNTLDNMVSGVVVTDTEGFITYTNQSAADIFRISTDELKGNYYSLLQDRRVDNQGKGAPLEQSAIYLALHQQQTTRDMQAGFKNSDGSVTWLNVNGAPLIDENGKPYGAVISFIDQTAAIKARIQTEKSENNLRAILNNMVSGVVVTDSKGEITYINQSGAEIVGISKDSAAGNN